MKGNAYWGTGTPKAVPSIASTCACYSQCSQISGCTGATFNSQNNTCYLVNGDGNVVASTPNNYAIIPLSQKYLLNMQDLNKQLTDINQQIMQIIQNEGGSMYTSEVSQRASQNKELEKNFPRCWPHYLKISMKNGQTYDFLCQYPPGREQPISSAQVDEKFLHQCRF
jgi:hypothetical protein